MASIYEYVEKVRERVRKMQDKGAKIVPLSVYMDISYGALQGFMKGKEASLKTVDKIEKYLDENEK